MNIFLFSDLNIDILYVRYVPTEDLVNIYTRYYGREVVTEEEITACQNWIYLGR